MMIRPLRPLLLPAILLVIISSLAALLPTFKPVDDTIIRLVQATPRNWENAIILTTQLGDVLPLTVVALTVSLWELVRRNYVRSLVMICSLISLPAFFLIKEVVRRARPVSDFVVSNGLNGYSFPSGHSTGTMAVYGMIAFLAYSHLKGSVRAVVVGLCTLVIVSVSFTRVYLGAHYPTDVFAGWLLAVVIISLLRTLSLYLAKRSSAPASAAITDTTESVESLEK